MSLLCSDSVPSIEDLSRGCKGDASSSLLSILSSLLSRCLTHLPSTRRYSLHGKKLSDIPVTSTNRDELLRLFLSQADGDGPMVRILHQWIYPSSSFQLSSALSSSSFLCLSPDQKAAVMGTLVNEVERLIREGRRGGGEG